MIEALSLFTWKSEVVLQTTSGSVTVHLRTLSGVQDEQRTDAALAASQVTRTELEDENSVLYGNHIAPLLGLHREGLLEVIRSLQRGLFVRMAKWTVEPYGDPDPPEEQLVGTNVISKPDLVDVMDWKDEKSSLLAELEERRKEWVDEQMAALDEELAEVEDADLQSMAIDLHKATIYKRAYNREWDYQTIFAGSFKDEKCKKPFFSDVQEVRDLPRPYPFYHIAAAYIELDTFSRDPEALKNS